MVRDVLILLCIEILRNLEKFGTLKIGLSNVSGNKALMKENHYYWRDSRVKTETKKRTIFNKKNKKIYMNFLIPTYKF